MNKIIYKLFKLILVSPLFCNASEIIETKVDSDVNSLEIVMPADNTKQSLTTQEKDYFFNTVNKAIKVITDDSILEDLSQDNFFDEQYPIFPKSSTKPVTQHLFIKNKLLTLTFLRINDKSPWEKATIIFDRKDLKNLKTNFNQEDFTKTLQLELKDVQEKIQKYPNSDEELRYYVYEYLLKDNENIKMTFNVFEKQFIDKNYPRNFYLVTIEKVK